MVLKRIGFLCLFIPSLVIAQSFSGRITTTFFTYERSDTVGISTRQLRGYQGFLLDFRRQRWLIRAYGQFDHDLSSPLSGDPRVRMYQLHARWRSASRKWGVQLGRQLVFSGVASGTIDGIQLQISPIKWLRARLFAGSLMPSHQKLTLIENPDQNFLMGGRLRFLPHRKVSLNFSYFNKKQTRPGYNTIRADSLGNVYTQFIQPATRAFQMVGFDGSWQIHSAFSLYGRTDMDLYATRITRGEIRMRLAPTPEWEVNAAYTYRSPRLPWNSIFSVFNVEENHEIEAGLYYRASPEMQITAAGALILYPGDTSFRFSIGTNTEWGSITYVQRGGYAGDLQSINAYLYRYIHGNQWLPTLQISWARYRLASEVKQYTALLSAAFGINYRPATTWSVDGQLQLLSNRFYQLDTRLLVRLQTWFFAAGQK